MNYQLVSADVARKQVATTTAEADAEVGFGFLSYYAYAAIITIMVAVAAQADLVVFSAAVTAVAANGSLSFYSSAAAVAETVPCSKHTYKDIRRRPDSLLRSDSPIACIR